MKSERFLSEVELYHNPDLFFRLIGELNESEVFIDGKKVKALIDSGAQISSIKISLAKLGDQKLKNHIGFRGHWMFISSLCWICRNVVENSRG